ncbi:MAG: hydroxyacylglutathione hydrolase [Synechococcus sp.]
MPATPANDLGSRTVADGIHQLPVLNDNIIWIWVRDDQAVVVDPAVATPVITWLKEHGLQLNAVLQTHHHADHIGGTPKLLEHWPTAAVVAAAADRERIPFQTVSVQGGDRLPLLGQQLEVIDVRAHTNAHIAFVLPEGGRAGDPAALFCGDTLFGGGCGRLFEGTASEMHTALQRLGSLPADTSVHCAHDYTEANLRWAVERAPDHPHINARLEAVQALRRQGKSNLPSTVKLEQCTNLFLQASTPEELAALRANKDQWRG